MPAIESLVAPKVLFPSGIRLQIHQYRKLAGDEIGFENSH